MLTRLQFALSIIKHKEQPLLGRWMMNHSKECLDRKIYLANHDHCGPCGDIQGLPFPANKSTFKPKFEKAHEFQSNNYS
tara:strand:- start:64 stop:300 length:237 start_codon:yes stop_codon:yes gene_type:complete